MTQPSYCEVDRHRELYLHILLYYILNCAAFLCCCTPLQRYLSRYLHCGVRLHATKPAILVLTEVKIANSAGIWQRTLPSNLTQELWISLQAEPHRKSLFTAKSGIPYTAKNFSRWCVSVLQKLFRRPLTLTLLRHSYLHSMNWNKLTIAARDNLVSDMCHSTETLETYRWISGKRISCLGK